jgi:hypothetical protein
MGQQYIGTGRLGTVQSVAYTGTAGTITNAVGTQTYKVRVLVTTDAFVTTDSTTATSAASPVPAMSPEYFTVSPGQKVSAIQMSAGGTLYVTELA